MNGKKFSSVVDYHFHEWELIPSHRNNTELLFREADELYNQGKFSGAARDYISIGATLKNGNSDLDVENYQKAAYRFAISKGFHLIRNSDAKNLQIASEYFFAAIQISRSHSLWASAEATSQEKIGETWLHTLVRSTDANVAISEETDPYKITAEALSINDPQIIREITTGLVRLEYTDPITAEYIEQKLFDHLSKESIISLKTILLEMIHSSEKRGVSAKSQRSELFKNASADLGNAEIKLSNKFEKFFASRLDDLENVKQLLLEGLNLLSPFGMSSEKRFLHETINFIKEDLQKYQKAKDDFVIEEYDRIYSRLDTLRGEVQDQISWVNTCYLSPILNHIFLQMDEERNAVIEHFQPKLMLEIAKSKWPMSNPGVELEVGIEIKNLGNAKANEVNILFFVSDDCVNFASILNPEIPLGSLEPNKSENRILVMRIIKATSIVTIDAIVSWSGLRGNVEEIFKLKVISQDKVNWDKVKNSPPLYSLKSKNQKDQLKGREEIINVLLAGTLVAKSYFITGQRRVGKTSIARVLESELSATSRAIAVYRPWGKMITGSGASIPKQFFGYICEAILKQTEKIISSITGLTVPSLEDLTRSYSHSFELFLEAYHEKYPEFKIVLLIDDIDEMPESFYRSEDGSSFFTTIRGFLDEDYLSYVFIGNEKLAAILEAQKGKLNKIATQHVDYLSREIIDRLVKEPTEGILEFDSKALEKIYLLSAGNPYYATLLCEKIFDKMINQEDYMVAKENVEKAREELVNNESTEAFIHFWADGIVTDDPEERGRIQEEQARVLIAISRQYEDPLGFVEIDVLRSQEVLKGIDPTIIETRLRGLITRDVVNTRLEGLGQVRIKVPLFVQWLKSRGTSKILEVYKPALFAPTLASSDIPENDILHVCQDLIYRGNFINSTDIRSFLSQFGRPIDQKLILKLLLRIRDQGYWSERRMRDKVRITSDWLKARFRKDLVFIKDNGGRLKFDNLFTTCIDGVGKSGQDILRMVRSEVPELYSPNIDDVGQVAKNIRGFLRNPLNSEKKAILLIVDDFVGTGDSSIKSFRYSQDVIENQLRTYTDNLIIVYAVLTGFETGIHKIETQPEAYGITVYCPEKLTERDKAFTPTAKIFNDENERLAARDICQFAGQYLTSGEALGHGDCQALVVFRSSVPNNSLPIFWSQGKHWRTGNMWRPLFPRHAVIEE